MVQTYCAWLLTAKGRGIIDIYSLEMLLLMIAVGSFDLVIQNQAWACWLHSPTGHPRFIEGICLTAACGLANLIVPLRSGVALRLAYMRLQHQIRVGAMIMGVSISYVMTLFVGILLLIPVLPDLPLVIVFKPEYRTLLIYGMIAISLGVAGLLFLTFGQGSKKNNWMIRVMHRLRVDFHWVLDSPGMIYRLFFWTLASAMIEISILYLTQITLGLSPGWQSLLWLAGMMTLSIFISITPGGIGIQEGVLVTLFMLQGGSVDAGIEIALARRIAVSMPVIIFGIPAWIWLHQALLKAWNMKQETQTNQS